MANGKFQEEVLQNVYSFTKHSVVRGRMDHAGFSTYESLYRAKEIFEADKIIIVTQEYHLYRALYIAEKLGVEAYGVASDYHTYAGQSIQRIEFGHSSI